LAVGARAVKRKRLSHRPPAGRLVFSFAGPALDVTVLLGGVQQAEGEAGAVDFHIVTFDYEGEVWSGQWWMKPASWAEGEIRWVWDPEGGGRARRPGASG
jgi:hypothetical protein